MRILYFISTHGHGRGGHFHSLSHISSKMASGHDVSIISIGPGNSQIIRDSPQFLNHIWFNGVNVFHTRDAILSNINLFRPEILHCFDASSYAIVTSLVNTDRFKVVLTKCGGPNPRVYPFARNLIVFSREDYDWFCTKKTFKDSRITLIPNRVNPVLLDSSWRPVEKVPGSFVFVRICRIGRTHRKSVEDSMQLISYFHTQGYRHVRLLVIGVIEDMDVFSELNRKARMISSGVQFLTDSQVTEKASRMLYLADAVVGTGRGFMEAASVGVPLLTLNAEDRYPVLIDGDNYLDAFRTNFSQRNRFTGYDRQRNLDKIERLVTDRSYAAELSALSRRIFETDCDVSHAENRYTEFYREAATNVGRRLRNLMFLLREMYHSYKSSKQLSKQRA